jgi:glutamate synthase domain-containing protein 1
LVNGPFSIIVGYTGGLMALNDRLKLRSLMAAEKDDMVYFASEESAIRVICPEPDKIWSVGGGEPVIVNVERSDI